MFPEGTATAPSEPLQDQPIGVSDDAPAAAGPALETRSPIDDGATLLAAADSHGAPADQTPSPAAETPLPESSPLREYPGFANLSAEPPGPEMPFGTGHGVARVAVAAYDADRLLAVREDKRNFRHG